MCEFDQETTKTEQNNTEAKFKITNLLNVDLSSGLEGGQGVLCIPEKPCNQSKHQGGRVCQCTRNAEEDKRDKHYTTPVEKCIRGWNPLLDYNP